MFKNLFKRKQPKIIPPLPEWDKIVERMYDKQLGSFVEDVVSVIYSKDKEKRYVILRNESGLYTYRLEAIYPYDEEEWQYIYSDADTLPAAWAPLPWDTGKSIFANEEELRKELKAEPEYKQYF